MTGPAWKKPLLTRKKPSKKYLRMQFPNRLIHNYLRLWCLKKLCIQLKKMRVYHLQAQVPSPLWLSKSFKRNHKLSNRRLLLQQLLPLLQFQLSKQAKSQENQSHIPPRMKPRRLQSLKKLQLQPQLR